MLKKYAAGERPPEVLEVVDHAPLTDEERRVIRALKRLAKTWPESLWIFAAGGTFTVMRKPPVGESKMEWEGGGADPKYIIETILGIEIDGGGW